MSVRLRVLVVVALLACGCRTVASGVGNGDNTGALLRRLDTDLARLEEDETLTVTVFVHKINTDMICIPLSIWYFIESQKAEIDAATFESSYYPSEDHRTG